ncbi:uncharacterized protein CDAR_29401 [Caerostris darwini]|uniref:Uncharacterized protein n=1 Tax=Caerostris darwini TaxID=1538125 RepID=A0AAV4TSS7_9ARAC|nr:uncharacterized protein CDAR_29401 [Caerostris darwini]
MALLQGKKFVKRRTKPKVIQYRKYKESLDEDEHYHLHLHGAVGVLHNIEYCTAKKGLSYVALSHVTSAARLYILNNYTPPPPPPHKDDPILQELKRLRERSIVKKFKFLRKHCDPNTLQIMYHNVQPLSAHYDDIEAGPCFMNSDILLLSETWTILRDTFELNGFDHHHLVSDLSWRRPSGGSIYIKHHFKPLVESNEMFTNQDLGIHVLVANFKTKVRVAGLYAKPGSSDDGITDANDESMGSKNRDYKIVLAFDFNIDMGKIMYEIYYMTLRNNIAQYTMKARTTIDAVFSTHSVRTRGMFDSSVFSQHLPLYVQIPWEKNKISYGRSTRTGPDPPRLECGPDPWNFAAQIDWEGDDDGYPM